MSEFENIFGAGANINRVIDSINRSNRAEQSEREREVRPSRGNSFDTFKEACAWAKNNPGKSITRSPGGAGFVEIRKEEDSTEKQKKKTEFFVISIEPGEIEGSDSFAASSASMEIQKILDAENSDMKSVINFIHEICSTNGGTETISIDRPPPSASFISETLMKLGWQLSPVSKNICLIDGLYLAEGSIDGALITENGITSLIAAPREARRLYSAIMNI